MKGQSFYFLNIRIILKVFLNLLLHFYQGLLLGYIPTRTFIELTNPIHHFILILLQPFDLVRYYGQINQQILKTLYFLTQLILNSLYVFEILIYLRFLLPYKLWVKLSVLLANLLRYFRLELTNQTQVFLAKY